MVTEVTLYGYRGIPLKKQFMKRNEKAATCTLN